MTPTTITTTMLPSPLKAEQITTLMTGMDMLLSLLRRELGYYKRQDLVEEAPVPFETVADYDPNGGYGFGGLVPATTGFPDYHTAQYGYGRGYDAVPTPAPRDPAPYDPAPYVTVPTPAPYDRAPVYDPASYDPAPLQTVECDPAPISLSLTSFIPTPAAAAYDPVITPTPVPENDTVPEPDRVYFYERI